MIINEAGEYTLQYTATDACGNSTTVERDLVVEAPPRTVLYTDGTFIINELSRDINANIQAHGQPTNIYPPLDADHSYVFNSVNDVYWRDVSSLARYVQFGDAIKPTNMAYWFYGFLKLSSFDQNNLNTEDVTSFAYSFYEVAGQNVGNPTIDISEFSFQSATTIEHMFDKCRARAIVMGTVNAPYLENASYTFANCTYLNNMSIDFYNIPSLRDVSFLFLGCGNLSVLNIVSMNTNNATNLAGLFYSMDSIVEIDISNLRLQNALDVSDMFRLCSALTTIYADANFSLPSSVTNSANMFNSCDRLVGGAGTTYSYSHRDGAYAKIDGGTSDPGYFTARS